MKEYHFEPDNNDLDQTIRLDDINEELKKIEKEMPVDDLGDANDFLNAFESERFERTPREPQEVLVPASVQRNGEEQWDRTAEPTPQRMPEGNGKRQAPQKGGAGQEPFMNKRNATILAVVAVLVAVLAFALVGKFFGGGKNEIVPAGEASAMLVQGVLDGGELVVYDITQKATKTVTLTEKTVVTDALERVVPESDITMGDLVYMSLDAGGKNAVTIDFGGDILRTEETGLTVDTGKQALVGEKASYTYDPKTIVVYNGEELPISQLENCDVLKLYCIGDTVWSIEVLEYHGYIVVENAENIVNGKFKLDEEEPKPLEEVDRIAVTEGTHTILVTGDNIEKRTDSVIVGTGEELIYDLSKAQEKVGVLIVNANVTEYKLYINGTLVDSTAPAVLPLGEYDLVILKNGYTEWSQHVNLQGDTLTVDASLQKDVQYGTLTIAADVDGAKAFIDQKEMGTVPLELNLPYGTYQLTVSKSGYDAYESTIVVSGTTMFVKAELQ